MDRSSLFKMSGLPDPFGVVLLVLSLILLLAPYFSGTDFGLFKIPIVNEGAKKLLKIIGPILFVSCILFFAPIFPDNKGASATSFPPHVLPTSSTEPAATPTNVNGPKRDTNSSNTGNLSVNTGNAEATKTEPPSYEKTANTSAASTQTSYAISNNWNEEASMGNPPSPTEFTIRDSYMITKIVNLHRGWTGIPPPGAVMKLRNSAGKEFGPWRVSSGNSEHWVCSPLIQIPAGTYTVIDPDPATWSQNGSSKHQGMSLVEGYATPGKTE